jgi:hypothetical protein
LEFEWDETKRSKVLADHGVDLLKAAQMFRDPLSIEIFPDVDPAKELRYNAIGKVGEDWYDLTFAFREGKVRLITAWKLNEKTRRKAQARYARRLARNAAARGDR